MKNSSETQLVSITRNDEIVAILKKNKRFNFPFLTIWIVKTKDSRTINYALLVNKSQFKLAVTRNKIKRQLRNILISSTIRGGIDLLIKPNASYTKKSYIEVKTAIINTLNRYQNGK